MSTLRTTARRVSAIAVVGVVAAVLVPAGTASAASTWEDDDVSVAVTVEGFEDTNSNGVLNAGELFTVVISVTRLHDEAVVQDSTMRTAGFTFHEIIEATNGPTAVVRFTASLPPWTDPTTVRPRLEPLSLQVSGTYRDVNVDIPIPFDYVHATASVVPVLAKAATNSAIAAEAGDTVHETITLENTGTLPATFRITAPNGYVLTLDIAAGEIGTFHNSFQVTEQHIISGTVPARPYTVTASNVHAQMEYTTTADSQALTPVPMSLGASATRTGYFLEPGTTTPRWPLEGDIYDLRATNLWNSSNVGVTEVIAEFAVGDDVMTCSAGPIPKGDGMAADCAGTEHVVTLDDLRRGYIDAWVTVKTTVGGTTHTVDEYPYRALTDTGAVGATATATGALTDANSDGFANEGEKITYTISTVNSSVLSKPDAELTVSDAGDLSLVDEFGSRTVASKTDDVFTATYTVTKADEARGSITYTPTIHVDIDGSSVPDITTDSIVIETKNAIGEEDLLDDARGGVTVTSPATPGSKVTVTYPAGTPGEQVNVVLFSEPVALGAHTMGAANSFEVTIPQDSAPGQHRIALYDENDVLLGWAPLVVEANENLSDTGANGIVPLSIASALLLALGAGLLVVRRRQWLQAS